jgi:hypothetical protein
MDWSTIFWTFAAFASAYSVTMAGLPPSTGYFSWAAVSAGFAALISYHVGKGQQQGGMFMSTPKT